MERCDCVGVDSFAALDDSSREQDDCRLRKTNVSMTFAATIAITTSPKASSTEHLERLQTAHQIYLFTEWAEIGAKKILPRCGYLSF